MAEMTPTELEWRALAQQAWGALNFILAFYEPGQTYLDTNAWKQAEAGGRRAHAALQAKLDESAQPHVDETPAALPAVLEALKGMVAEWDQLTRYGSPMAKAANPRLQAARAAIALAEEAQAKAE